ncbi:MAG: hypothetical protein Q8O89_01955 [Nanoarchaeota archaeon]|nr:hypothetical protein [Nanoarchaeota archaeon]
MKEEEKQGNKVSLRDKVAFSVVTLAAVAALTSLAYVPKFGNRILSYDGINEKVVSAVDWSDNDFIERPELERFLLANDCQGYIKTNQTIGYGEPIPISVNDISDKIYVSSFEVNVKLVEDCTYSLDIDSGAGQMDVLAVMPRNQAEKYLGNR